MFSMSILLSLAPLLQEQRHQGGSCHTEREGTIPVHPQLPPGLGAESTADELFWKPRCCLSAQLTPQATEIYCSMDKRLCLLTAHLPGRC